MDTPWLGDACSLVDAFRSGERSPVEEVDACLEAIEASELNAFSHLDPDAARKAAAAADVSRPFGGVPTGIKELTAVQGWPNTEASLVFKDRIADRDSTHVARLREAGAVPIGLTTASEFGGINMTRTKLNGTTRNPWNTERTPGGSSGGSSAAVAGGLVPIASGGDGGGSIRIPAAFTGLFGLKCTYGRIPKSPRMTLGSLTSVPGCLSRSVRDTARWIDATNGFDSRDPFSLPRVDGWEAGLGKQQVHGRRAAIVLDFGGAVVDPEVQKAVSEAADSLVRDAGLEVVDVDCTLPSMDVAWALAGSAPILAELGDRWPECAPYLTPQIKFVLEVAHNLYDFPGRAQIEERRTRLNEAMAEIFDQVDFVITATNPDVAFDANGPMPTEVGGRQVEVGNNGALTIPANTYGNPGVSIPIGTVRELPVGMQIMGRHHEEQLLLDLALIAERERPWPLVAPGAPC